MLEEVITNRNAALTTLNLFKEVKGLCKFIGKSKEDGTVMTFPAIYEGNDSLKFVTQYDFRNGVLFHVQREAVSIERLDTGLRANNDLLRYNYPMQCIAIVGAKKIDDNNYTPDKLGWNLSNKINGRINSLRLTLGLNAVNVDVENINTEDNQVDEIFTNVELKFKHELVIATIDYSVLLDGYQDCFTPYTC